MISMQFRRLERRSVTQALIEQITSYMECEEVDPGYKLPSEQELMRQFGVARSTIREALHALVVLGVLESKPGKGYYVKRGYRLPLYANNLQKLLLQDESFFNLLEARESVERTIAVLASQRATNDDIQAMEEALEGVKHAIDNGEDPTEHTVAVHLLISRASHNEVLVGLMEQLLPMIAEKARKVQIPAKRNYEEHKDLVDGIK
ncbi:FadR family transcriptional regulator, partial [Candidatus Bipolaricaulota bacterium]|nr:FadR family transcriptional regulator [Candidatus Bipolaricaulota bacterium]